MIPNRGLCVSARPNRKKALTAAIVIGNLQSIRASPMSYLKADRTESSVWDANQDHILPILQSYFRPRTGLRRLLNRDPIAVFANGQEGRPN